MLDLLIGNGQSATAIAFGVVGYMMASLSISDWERVVKDILIPLYHAFVTGYLVIRIYHAVIEPRLIATGTQTKKKKELRPIEDSSDETTKLDEPVNLTGLYKLIENQNFEELLGAQGVPWALRRAANMARPTHRISHKGNSLTIKIEGIIESQTTYTIGGPPVKISVRDRPFEDRVTYLEDNRGVQTIKRALNDGYTVRVSRRLSSDRSSITMLSSVHFDDKSKQAVQCRQLFQRVDGPCS